MRRWKRRWSSLENRKKVLNLLGLATRAGKTASGEFMTEQAHKSGKAYLGIVSEAASDNTKKMIENCRFDINRLAFESGNISEKAFRHKLVRLIKEHNAR